jgi:hypothetical protein
MKRQTIAGKTYVVLTALDSGDENKLLGCRGCAFEYAGGCPTEAACVNDEIYVEDTPEDITEYVKEKLG